MKIGIKYHFSSMAKFQTETSQKVQLLKGREIAVIFFPKSLRKQDYRLCCLSKFDRLFKNREKKRPIFSSEKLNVKRIVLRQKTEKFHLDRV